MTSHLLQAVLSVRDRRPVVDRTAHGSCVASIAVVVPSDVPLQLLTNVIGLPESDVLSDPFQLMDEALGECHRFHRVVIANQYGGLMVLPDVALQFVPDLASLPLDDGLDDVGQVVYRVIIGQPGCQRGEGKAGL